MPAAVIAFSTSPMASSRSATWSHSAVAEAAGVFEFEVCPQSDQRLLVFVGFVGAG